MQINDLGGVSAYNPYAKTNSSSEMTNDEVSEELIKSIKSKHL